MKSPDYGLGMDLVSKLVPVTKNLKPTAHFIFEKWICTMEPLTLKQKRRPSKIVCTFRPALHWRRRTVVSIYSLFKPEPEARITCKVYRYPYSRFPTPLLSCGTTPLLSNIRFAVLRAAHEARSAEVERSDQLGRNNLPAALT